MAKSNEVEKIFVNSIRPDRASGGFRAFLEVHANARGLRIVEISPEGPADSAGLKVGDLIIALDDEPLPCWNSDLDRVKGIDRLYSAGDVVAVSFERSSDAGSSLAEAALQETQLTLVTMALETQEELLRWVAIAEQRLADNESLYCRDIRPSESGTHHVCHDDSSGATEHL